MSSIFTQDGILVLARVLGLLFAIPVHEVSHAWVSDKLGDPTARMAGRLTLNPIKHFDPLGLLSMLIIGVGWAKPVRVDARYYKSRKLGMALTAAAGPLSNLILAFFTMLAFKLFGYGFLSYFYSAGVTEAPGWYSFFSQLLWYFALINVSLALFNLLPIPPLDGSRIFGIILPDRLYDGLQRIERYIMIALLAAVFLLPRLTGFDPIGWLLGDAVGAVLNALDAMTGFVAPLFGFST